MIRNALWCINEADLGAAPPHSDKWAGKCCDLCGPLMSDCFHLSVASSDFTQTERSDPRLPDEPVSRIFPASLVWDLRIRRIRWCLFRNFWFDCFIRLDLDQGRSDKKINNGCWFFFFCKVNLPKKKKSVFTLKCYLFPFDGWFEQIKIRNTQKQL